MTELVMATLFTRLAAKTEDTKLRPPSASLNSPPKTSPEASVLTQLTAPEGSE